MKQVLFLAALAFFLNFGLVSCSSKKAEQAQEVSQGTIEETGVEAYANTSQSSSQESAETANTQAAE
jgi:HAMP domain-containing protein